MGVIQKTSTLSWEFPSGAVVRFAHLEHEKNRLDWQGAQTKTSNADSTKTKSARMDKLTLQDFLLNEGFSHKMAARLACQAFNAQA